MSEPTYSRDPVHLNSMFGVPRSPMDVVNRMIDLGRQAGKTQALIDALPADGRAKIMVWRLAGAKHIRRRIIESRGLDYPVNAIKFVTMDSFTKKNLELPLFIDNAVFDAMIDDKAREIFKAVFSRGAN